MREMKQVPTMDLTTREEVRADKGAKLGGGVINCRHRDNAGLRSTISSNAALSCQVVFEKSCNYTVCGKVSVMYRIQNLHNQTCTSM